MKIIKRLIKFDGHMKEVLLGASLAFVLRGAGAGVAFLFNVVVARLLGVEGTGLFFMALSVTMIGSVVARMGLDNALIRFVATNVAKGDWGNVKGVHSLGLKIGGGVSLGLAILLSIFAPWISAHIFNEPSLTDLLRWMSLAIFPFSVMTLLSESLKGLKRIKYSMLVSGVFSPIVGLILIWPLVWLFGTVGGGITYLLATAVSSLWGWYFWRIALIQHTAASKPFPVSELWTSSRPLWLMMVVNRALLPWLPLFLLGIWGSAADVGQYGAATRIVMLVSFFLTAVNTMIGPKVAELYTHKDYDSVHRIVKRFSLLITLASTPIFIVLIFQGDFVMGMFGDSFAKGGTVLSVLALGQAITTVTGLAGFLLIMAGHENDVQNTSVVALIVLVIMSIVLIPSYGMIGAAWATVIATACSNLLSAFIAWKRLNINVMPH
jgi:O-antigen/teichoic acid export membrane protein